MDLRITPRTVQKQTVETLREAIISGIFKPGERLVEAELCHIMGVSRPSVREALRSLEAERLVATIPNRGTQVRIVSWEEAQQIYQVRWLLEGEAAALSAQRARTEHVEAMRAALDGFAAAVEANDRSGLLKTTADFYDVLLISCGNTIIEEVLRGLLARISFLRDRSMSRTGRARYSLKELKAILTGVAKNDAEAARRAAERHVEQASVAARESYLLDTGLPESAKPVPVARR